MKRKLLMIVLVLLTAFSISEAKTGQAADGVNELIDLSPKQVAALSDTMVAYSEKMEAIIKNLENTFEELTMEALKAEGPEIPKKQRKNPKKIDKLIRKISSLTGEILKAKTEYILKAKDVLTKEQKELLISDLEYQVDFFDGQSPFLFKLDDLAEILELNTNQIKSILKYRTKMSTKELKLKMDAAFLVLDIKDILDSAEKKPAGINAKVMKIADIGAQLLNNKVNYILKARSVLTKPQKQELRHLLLLNLHAF